MTLFFCGTKSPRKTIRKTKQKKNPAVAFFFIAEIKTKFMKADKIASRKEAEAKLHLVIPPAFLGTVLKQERRQCWGSAPPRKR